MTVMLKKTTIIFHMVIVAKGIWIIEIALYFHYRDYMHYNVCVCCMCRWYGHHLLFRRSEPNSTSIQGGDPVQKLGHGHGVLEYGR